ncbi:MAG: endonuclease [Patescibacteria group bacterium]|nr:endonuclease [Patescibacteria group bacterium]
MNPASVFRRKIEEFYKQFGPQGWWPRLVSRHEIKHFPGPKSGWLLKGEKLEIWEPMMGAILTQNVAWNNVEQALLNMAKADVLTPEQVIKCHVLKLGRLVKPARYYSQKAKKLKIAAEWLKAYNVPRTSNNVAELRSELLDLWGVGPETADTILAYGFNRPVFVVDIYTRRLLYILSGDESWITREYDEIKNFCEKSLVKSKISLPEAHALIVRWGKVDGGRMAR